MSQIKPQVTIYGSNVKLSEHRNDIERLLYSILTTSNKLFWPHEPSTRVTCFLVFIEDGCSDMAPEKL